MEDEGGELTLEVEEEVLSEVDAVAVLQILVEEVKIQIPVNQVIRNLINQRFNVITIKSMDIMHMSVERDNIIRTSKVKIIHTTQTIPPALCLWCVLKQCL
jgi:hypothetical protein